MGVVSGQSPVPSRRNYTLDLGSVGTGRGDGHDQTSAPWPDSRVRTGVWGGVRADALPSGRAQGSGLCRPAAAGPIPPLGHTRAAFPGPRLPPARPAPRPRGAAPDPELCPGLAAADTRQRSAAFPRPPPTPRPRVPASPRPESRRGAVSACVARARAGGGGLCLRPSGAGPPNRVPCPPSPGARTRPSPRVRGAARLWAPDARGPPESNPAPTSPPRGLGH